MARNQTTVSLASAGLRRLIHRALLTEFVDRSQCAVATALAAVRLDERAARALTIAAFETHTHARRATTTCLPSCVCVCVLGARPKVGKSNLQAITINESPSSLLSSLSRRRRPSPAAASNLSLFLPFSKVNAQDAAL
jgi:hypothetical protein